MFLNLKRAAPLNLVREGTQPFVGPSHLDMVMLTNRFDSVSDNFSKMQRTAIRCQAEENQHRSPLVDDLQDVLDRWVLGFSGSFPMMVGRDNLLLQCKLFRRPC